MARGRAQELGRKCRLLSHFRQRQQGPTSMTTSWHLYLVARFNRVSTSSTRRTYSCSTCEGKKRLSSLCRYLLPRSLTPVTKPSKVTGHTDLTPSFLRQQATRTRLLGTPEAVKLCSQSSTVLRYLIPMDRVNHCQPD